MNGKNSRYSTRRVSSQLLSELKSELRGMDYGSLEVYVNDSRVTQITKRQIRKTSKT